jgi:hypothetical protein
MTDYLRTRDSATVLVLGVVALFCVVVLSGVPGTSAGQQEATAQVHGASPDLVQVDEDVTISYTADGPDVSDGDVELVFTHPSGETLTFSGSAGESVEQEIQLEPHNLRPGPYTVTVRIADGPSDTEEDAFEIAPLYDPSDVNFATSGSSAADTVATYRSVAGDFLEVSVSLTDAEEAYILFGGNRGADETGLSPPMDILHVEGSTTFLVNTRLVGTDRPSEEVYVATEGSVTSYAHTLGPDSEPTGVFSDLRFETKEYDAVAETLAEFRAEAGLSPQVRPLQPGQYSLVIGSGDSFILNEDGVPDPRYPLDRASVELTQPRLGNVTTYTVPTGNANEVEFQTDPEEIEELTPENVDSVVGLATQTDTITQGDRLLVEVEANGLYGALFDSAGARSELTGDEDPTIISGDQFAELLDRPEGISFSLTHTNSKANKKPIQFDLADADPDNVAIVLDPSYGPDAVNMETFYVLIDTREPSPFSPALEGGEQFRLTMSYESDAGERYRFASSGLDELSPAFNPVTEQFPYFSGPATTFSQTASIGFEETFVEYDRTSAKGNPVVTNTTGATISGTTNLAPGSNLPVKIVVDVRHRPIKVEATELSISEDGSFSAQVDLSDIDATDDVDIQFWAYQELLDERSLTVVKSEDATAQFQITGFTTQSIVRANETLVDLSTTVANTGLLTGTESVELLIDGSVVAERTVELAPNEVKTFHFENATSDMEAGEYAVEVRTPSDRVGNLLIVEEPDSFFEVAALRANATLTPDGTAVDFSTTIVNTGVVNGTDTVELLVDGETVAQRPLGLTVGDSETFGANETFTDLDPGTHVVTVVTPDDSDSVEVTVSGSRPLLNITALNATTTVQQGETLDVTATIHNNGTIPGNGTVTLWLANTSLDERVVELGPGNETGLTFGNDTVDREPGEYTLTLATPHDERTVTLVVENGSSNEPDADDSDSDSGDSSDGEDGENDGDSDGDSSDEDDSENDGTDDGTQSVDDATGSDQEDGGEDTGGGAGFLGLSVGSRAVLGGTALVGAVHVLGYWA